MLILIRYEAYAGAKGLGHYEFSQLEDENGSIATCSGTQPVDLPSALRR